MIPYQIQTAKEAEFAYLPKTGAPTGALANWAMMHTKSLKKAW